MSPLLLAPPYLFSTESVGLMQIAAIIGFVQCSWLPQAKASRTHPAGPKAMPGMREIRRCSGQMFWVEEWRTMYPVITSDRPPPPACGNQLHWSAIAVGFGLVSFGSVYTPNIAITYIVHRNPRDAAKSLVLIKFLGIEEIQWHGRNKDQDIQHEHDHVNLNI
jgi:hypothetical protein